MRAMLRTFLVWREHFEKVRLETLVLGDFDCSTRGSHILGSELNCLSSNKCSHLLSVLIHECQALSGN